MSDNPKYFIVNEKNTTKIGGSPSGIKYGPTTNSYKTKEEAEKALIALEEELNEKFFIQCSFTGKITPPV